MTTSIPNPWINESAQAALPQASPATDVEFPSASVAPINSEVSDGGWGAASFGTAAATVNLDDTNVAADISSDTQYIVELFSDYARRRCMDKISPPLPGVDRHCEIDAAGLGAVRKALNIHPRDLDEDPLPLFLRKPRPAFLRALLELGGAR